MKFNDGTDGPILTKSDTAPKEVVDFHPKKNGKAVKINPDVLLAVIQSPLFASQPGNIEELTGEMVKAAEKFTEALGD